MNNALHPWMPQINATPRTSFLYQLSLRLNIQILLLVSKYYCKSLFPEDYFSTARIHQILVIFLAGSWFSGACTFWLLIILRAWHLICVVVHCFLLFLFFSLFYSKFCLKALIKKLMFFESRYWAWQLLRKNTGYPRVLLLLSQMPGTGSKPSEYLFAHILAT